MTALTCALAHLGGATFAADLAVSNSIYDSAQLLGGTCCNTGGYGAVSG